MDRINKKGVNKPINSLIFQLLVDSLEEAVTISQICDDGNCGKYIFVNDAVLQRLGYTKEEMMQLSPLEIHTSNDPQKLIDFRDSVLSKKIVGVIECEQLSKKGEKIPVTIKVQKAEIDGVKYLVCISQDLTEQKKLEAALEEETVKYHGLSDAAFEAIFISEKGICIEQNLAAEKMFGYTNVEAVGRYGTDWIVPENRELVMNHMIHGYEEPYEAVALRKDGTTFPCLLHGKMMYYKGKTVRVTSLTDLTYKKLSERVQRDSEDNFRRVISDMQVGVMLFGKDFEIIFCNPVALEFIGLKHTDVIGKSAMDSEWKFIQEDGNPLANKNYPIAKVFQTKKPVKDVIIGMKKPKNGAIVWLLVDTIPEFDIEGNFYRTVCTFIDITQRIEAERELFKSETLFREITEHSPSGVVLLNTDHSYRFVSSHFEKLSGFKENEILGLDPAQHIHPDDLTDLLDKLNKFVLEAGSTFTTQYRFVKKDGDYVWVESTFSNLLHIKGIETILINYKDIDDQKRSEEKIVNLEKQYTYLFENMLDGFAYCQMHFDEQNLPIDWTYIAVNNAFTALTGLENVIGKRVSQILPGILESDSRLFEIYGRVALTGITETFEMYVKALQLWFYVSVYSFQKGYFIAVFDNITEQKMTETIIQESNNKLMQAEKIAKIGYWELDMNTKKVYGSEGANQIYGNDISPISIEKLRSYRLPEFSKMVDERMQQLIEDNIPYELEFKIRNPKTNEIKDIHSIADYNSETKIIFGVIQDVTEINKIKNQLEIQNQELKKTNSELDKFVYSTSHDLRAPLKSVIGLINLLEKEDDITLIKEQMHMMKTSVVKLDDFIEDIMHYYRNTKLIVNRELLNFEEIIHKILYNLSNLDGYEKIKFLINIDSSTQLFSDKQRVTIILNNLIANSIKYRDHSKEEQFVKINVNNSSVSTNIEIEDNGIGIDEKDTDKIFGMFFRATQYSNGSGLGLYIVKETLDKIGGCVHVESTINCGTKFIVRIPLQH